MTCPIVLHRAWGWWTSLNEQDELVQRKYQVVWTRKPIISVNAWLGTKHTTACAPEGATWKANRNIVRAAVCLGTAPAETVSVRAALLSAPSTWTLHGCG